MNLDACVWLLYRDKQRDGHAVIEELKEMDGKGGR
jgi:hypothetical protein